MEFVWKTAVKEVVAVMGHFFEDFTPSKSSSLFQGFLHEYVDLRVKPDALHILGAPLLVEGGMVGSFSSNLDVASLISGRAKRFDVNIRNVRLRVTPSQAEHLSLAPLLEKRKQLNLVMAELFHNIFQGSAGGGFYELFLRAQVTIENVHITISDTVERFDLDIKMRQIKLRHPKHNSFKTGVVPRSHVEFAGLEANLTMYDSGRRAGSLEEHKLDFIKPVAGVMVVYHDYRPIDDEDEVDVETLADIQNKMPAEEADAAALMLGLDLPDTDPGSASGDTPTGMQQLEHAAQEAIEDASLASDIVDEEQSSGAGDSSEAKVDSSDAETSSNAEEFEHVGDELQGGGESSSEEAQSAGDAAEQGQGGGDSGASDGGASDGSASGGSASDSNAEAQSQSDAASDSDEDSDDEQDTDANTTDNDQDTDANTTDNPSDVVNEEDEPSLDLDGLSEAASSNFPTSRTDWSEDEEGSEYAEDEEYGWTFIVSLLTPLQVNVKPETLHILTSTFKRVTKPLFDDERGSQQNLDLLRWVPVRGHAREYWRYVLRRCLPMVVKKVAEQQGISMGDGWSDVYGLLSPLEHKEEYIKLYQRSLNLVQSDPLSPEDENKKKHLESLHASDTILIWRTEAKVRLIMERPSANMRLARQEYEELTQGLWSAMFTRVPDMAPVIELSEAEKREAFKQALKYHIGTLSNKVFSGWSLTLQSDHVPAARVRFLSDEPVMLELDDMLVELCYNSERVLVRAQAERFRELALTETGPRFFDQADGLASINAEFPASMWSKDSFTIFARYLHVLNTPTAIDFFTSFFHKRRTHERHRSSTFRLVQMQQLGNFPEPEEAREASLEVLISDSVLTVPMNPIAGSIDEFEVHFGNPFRSFVEELDPVYNIELDMQIKPDEGIILADLALRDMQVVWQTVMLDKEGRRKPLPKRRRRRLKKNTGFREVFMRHIEEWRFKAKLEQVRNTFLEHITLDADFGTSQARITERVLAQVLRICAHRIQKWEENQRRSGGRKKANTEPFSIRTRAQSLRVALEPLTVADQEREATDPSFVAEASLLASLMGAELQSSVVRPVFGRAAHEDGDEVVAEFGSTKESIARMFNSVLDQLVDGVIGLSRTSAEQTQHVGGLRGYLKPVLERLRMMLMDGNRWDRDYLEHLYVELQFLLAADVQRSDGQRTVVLCADSLESVMPQALSKALLDAFDLHDLMLSAYGDTHTKAYDHLSPQEVYNAEYLQLSVKKLCYYADASQQQVLSTNTELIHTLRRLERDNEVVKLSTADKLQLPNTDRVVWSLTVQIFEATFAARGHNFFLVVLEDFTNESERSSSYQDVEPDVSYDSFRLQFDVDLISHLLYLYTHRQESALATNATGSLVMVGMEIANLLNTYAYSDSIDSGEQVQMTLTIDDFHWEFLRRLESNKEFKLFADVTLAIPYAYFHPALHKEPLVILSRADVEMTVTKRRTPQRSHQNASWLKQQHDFVETTNVVGHLRKCEIFHALPASSRMPAGSFSQPDMRAATMNAASHLRNQMLEKLNAKEQEERDRVLEERRKREHEAKKAALAAGAEAPSDSDIPIHHPSDDEATRSRKKIYVSPEERKLQALMEEARQLRAEAARLRESGGASDIEDETDDLADLEDALAAAGRRLQSSSEEEESSMDEGSGGEGSMGESGFSDSDVPQAADVLPPLSQEYPLPKSAIRDKLGALVWRRVSQILEPTTISVHSGKENSGLNVHTSAEELRSFRKLINKRSQFYIDLPKDVHINMTMRDYFFLLRLLTKVLRRTRIGRAAAEVALGGGGDDNDHDDSKKEFEFRIKDGVGGDIIKHIQLLLQDEVELTLRSKWINILLLDGESDQSGRDPVLEIGLAGLTVWMSSFGSRVSLEADTTLSLGYGMLPDQVHDETTPTIGDAEIAPLLKPCPIELRLERDELTKHGSQHASMYMGTIKVRKEMLATLTRAFVLRTMRRLGSFTDIYYQLIGGEKLYTKPIEEDALREEELFDRRLLRNSTGTTLWYTHASRPGPGLSVVGNGAQKLINCNPALFHQQSSGDSPYAVDVQLDGNWSPSMGLELRSDYFQRFVVNSTMGPGYDRLQPKVVEVVCEAVYEDVPQSKLRGLPDEPTEQLVIDVHSTVQVTNDTLDPVYALESVVQPGESVWLPLMVVSTGEVSFRPSPEFSWTEPLKYPIPGVTETPETTGEVEAQEEVEGGEEGVEYVPKACRHSLTKQAWCYSLRVERDEKRGVTLIRVRSPIVLVNRLAAPLSVTITRPALKSIRFVWQSPAARAKALRRGKSNETITELAERGQVEPGKEWNVYGGGAYDQGIIRLHMKDSAECRVDGFTCRRGIDLSKPNQFKGGLVMQDERTGRTLYVYAADLASNPAEGRHFRRIVIFSQYQVIDYTCLQMKVSGDKMSYMSGHAPSKDTFTQTKETASLARIMYSFPPGTPDSGQTLHLSTPHCQRWSLPISVLEAVEELTDEQIASGDFELPSDVVRVPVSLHYSPLLSGQKSFGDLSLFTYFSAEVVATVRRSSLALFRQGRGPLVIECHPRVRLVNALGCAIAVRQLDTPSFRGSGPKDHEFPVVVPPGRTSPFVFYDDFDYESGLRPEPFIVKSLSVSPVFRSVPGRPVNSWEWSGQLPIHVSSTYSASCHNTNLSKRLIMKVKVKERQGYRTVVISNQNSRDVPFRVHNSSTQASVRFFQKPRGGADPTRRSLYKQTLHAGSTSALYAWDYPLDLDFEANDAGVDSVQYAPVLTVHVYATDGEVYEMDVDISSGRVGARHHLRLPGSQPDLLLQTRGDMETGAVVLVVSDYQLDAYSPLAAFETEEKRFLTTLMSKDRTVEQASLLLHDEAAQRLMESEADEAREPCVGYLTFRITGFEDVKFRDTVSVVYVVSFGKTTRKAIRDVRQVRREQFEEHTFYYNQHHDSEDDDYDTVYVDIYERHTFTGTTLKRTATIRRVHEVIKRTRRDRASFRVHLHNPAVKLHDDPSRKPKDHGTGFMTVEIATSSNLAPRVQHLPGTPRLMFTVACPSLKVSLVDERARTLLSAVSVRDKITIRQVLDRAEFGVLHLANLVSVSAHSSTHELTDLVLGNLELSKCFETDEASAAERKEREREARKKKKQQKGKRKSKKELQQLEDEVREHSYIISTDCSAESPLVHLQMLELEATRGFDHKVEEAALTMQPAWMKLDGPMMLRLIKYARLLELFVPAAQLDAESALARYRGLQVESLRINETAVHLSFTSARAPTLAGSSVEALAEASSAVASMASTAALSAFDMLKNSMTIEVTPRSERVVEEEPDAEDEDPTAQRGRIFVPAVEAPLSVHTSKRTYSSLLMEVLAHVAKYVVKDKLVEQRSNVEGMYGFRAIASYLTPMEQQLRKLREPVGELESLEDDGGLEDGL